MGERSVNGLAEDGKIEIAGTPVHHCPRNETSARLLPSAADDAHNSMAAILRELIIEYLGCDNSSIREDTAMGLLGSIAFTIETALFKRQAPDKDIAPGMDIRLLYAEGSKMIESSFEDAKRLYKKVYGNRLQIPMETYNDTLDTALPDFFKAYDTRFAAQETACSIDYPLALDDMSRRGIHYIRQYLDMLELETDFCRRFERSDILKLLKTYGLRYQMNIREVRVNLFELLFEQAVFCILCDVKLPGLRITRQEFERFERHVYSMHPHEASLLPDTAFTGIIRQLGIHNTGLVDYMDAYKTRFAMRFIEAVKNRSLSNIALTESEKPSKGKAFFTDGERMSDLQFTRLTEKIEQCADTGEKLKLIATHIHCCEDLMDMLESDCLYAGEYETLFATLSDMELAVTGAGAFDIGPCGANQAGLIKTLKGSMTGAVSEWQTAFIQYILGLGQSRISNIEAYVESLNHRDGETIPEEEGDW